MSTNRSKSDPKFVRAYDRAMLRSAFKSLFWSVIAERRKREDFTLQALAKILGTNKAEVSRWFSGDPNWTLNTVASLGNALDLEIEIRARERSTGIVFTPSGPQVSHSLRIDPLKPITKEPTDNSLIKARTILDAPKNPRTNVIALAA